MNLTVAHIEYSIPTTRLNVPGHDSLIDKIKSKLKTIAKSRLAESGTTPEYQSWVDANLLDETLGPEIRRCLRR